MILKYSLKKIAIAALAAVGMVSCSESYPSMEYDYSQAEGAVKNQDLISDRAPMMLFVNPQNFFTISASSRQTRGAGPFEQTDMDQYFKSTFYVYAFRKGKNSQGSTQTNPTNYARTAYALNNSSGMPLDNPEHEDCLLDGTDYRLGLSTRLDSTGSGELKIVQVQPDGSHKDVDHPENQYFFSAAYPNVAYDFYGYYFDNFPYDVSGNVNRAGDKITYQNVRIDGTQDILMGMAPNLNDVLIDRYKDQWEKMSINEQRTIHNDNGYTTFAAHHKIFPTIDLKHELSRIRFVIVPGDDSADDVVITGVSISSKNDADFVVAAPSIDQLGLQNYRTPNDENNLLPLAFPDKKDLDTLRVNGGTDYVLDPQGNYCIGYKTEKWVSSSTTYQGVQMGLPKYGRSMMLAPGDSTYCLKLTWSQSAKVDVISGSTVTKKDTVIHWESKYTVKVPRTKYNLKEGTNPAEYYFQPGIYYQIKIMVYGLQEMKIYTSIASWREEDEPIVINPDDDEIAH